MKRYPSTDQLMRAAVDILSGRVSLRRGEAHLCAGWTARYGGEPARGPLTDAEWERLSTKPDDRDADMEPRYD